MNDHPVTTMTKSDVSQPYDWSTTGLTIEALVQGQYAFVRRLAYSILEDAQEAEDAAQETFIAASRALSNYRGEGQVRTWLVSIAVNLCRDRLRRRKVRQAMQLIFSGLQILAGRPVSPEETVVQNEADRELWQAVDNLDEKHRMPIVLRYGHEMTVPEIAAALGISQGTVHSRLYYARQILSERLGNLHLQEESSDESVSS